MISPKEKARELYGRYLPTLLPVLNPKEEAKTYAIICVNEIQEALEEYDTRNNTYELQNMDSDFRYWKEVRKELGLL